MSKSVCNIYFALHVALWELIYFPLYEDKHLFEFLVKVVETPQTI